jgi:hypothetical protein
MTPQVQQNLKHGGDAIFGVGALATLFGYLPAIAAGLSAVWFTLQIIEKITGKPIPTIISCLWNRARGLR